MKTQQKGTTLLELVLASALFTIIMLVLIAITRYSIISWKAIEDRVEIQTKIRKIESGLMNDLLGSSYSSVITYPAPGNDDSIHAVAFKSYKSLTTGNFDTDESGLPIFHGYILYLLVRPTDDPCGTAPSTTDNKSPYKLLVRVDLTRTTDGTDTWDPLEFSGTTDALKSQDLQKYIPATGNYFKRQASVQGGSIVHGVTKEEYLNAISGRGGDSKYVDKVSLVATDVLSFNVRKKPDPRFPEIQTDIRIFKINEAQKNMKIGTDDLSDSKYTISVRTNIIPRNP